MKPTHYIGIGASAGGLEAIEAFFTHMPPDNGLAFIVVQHLAPDYKSLMVELLSKHTSMSVQRIEEGMEIKANHVYLIPPKKNVTVFHGHFLLHDQDRSLGINLPIDMFLRSLAEDQTEKAIAIILSGTGSDGTRGIRAVKEEGGMVMVQSESSAKFDGMPKSAIATGLCDFILPADELPQQLLSFVKHPYAAKSDTQSAGLLNNEDGLTRIFSMLRETSKVDFTYYKPATVFRRIERRMAINQVNELPEYVRFLECYPNEVDTLYRELLIGVTTFFRDPESFSELSEKYLPELLDESKDDEEIRFWVAGCSTGEEAYSLAIMTREYMERTGRRNNVKIFATDVDRDAIMCAGNGVYAESIVGDVPNELLGKYFHRSEGHFQIARPIREMVVFAQHNLIKDPPFTNISLVSCRNVLIYLQPILQKKIFELFNFSLRESGILFLGSSETLGEGGENFDLLHNKARIYRLKRKIKGGVGFSRHFKMPGELANLARQRYVSSQRGGITPREEERLLNRLLQFLSEEYVPLCVLVNQHNEPLHVVGKAAPYFTLPMGQSIHDVTKMAVHELSIPLATGLQKVFKNQPAHPEVRYTNIRLNSESGETRVLQMHIKRLPEKKGQDAIAAVFIQPLDKKTEKNEKMESYDLSKESEQRISDLEQDLQFTRENLQATIEELETSNEELQATNEELLASNEELQSTNEELQSVNEELHTVNSEHQHKIIELTELTNDLDNLLRSTRVGLIFLDEHLSIRRFTPEAVKVFNLLDSDIGRPFEHISHNLTEVDLLPWVREVLLDNREMQREVKSKSGNTYILYIQPYLIGPNIYAGVIVNLVNINEIKEIQEKLVLKEKTYSLAGDIAGVGAWEWNSGKQTVIWSEEARVVLDSGQAIPTCQALDDFLKMLHKDDREKVSAAFNATAGKEGCPELEYRLIREGETVWISSKASCLHNSTNGGVSQIGIIQNISRQKAMELELRRKNEALEKKNEELQHYIDQPFVGMIAFSPKTKKIFNVNRRFCEITGYTRDELQHANWMELIHPDDLTGDITQLDKVPAGGQDAFQMKKRYIHKDGREIPVYLALNCVHNENGDAEYFVGAVQVAG